jgi:hypothetical protein
MDNRAPSSITIEEAVARMVNMDYIPTGFALHDMTAAFLEEAEVDYEDAKIERLPEHQVVALRLRMDACRARHFLTQMLLESLQHEVKNPKESLIKLSGDSSSICRLKLESVAEWASDRYGIEIPEWKPDLALEMKGVSWEDITIKLWKDYNIGLFVKFKQHKRSHFRQIGLMGQAKNEPSKVGEILVLLSFNSRFPKGRITPIQSTAISKLRASLRKWVGLSADPFETYNHEDGLKPRFKIINDENNASDRVMKRATSLDDHTKKQIALRTGNTCFEEYEDY